jgi:hypothetical protein
LSVGKSILFKEVKMADNMEDKYEDAKNAMTNEGGNYTEAKSGGDRQAQSESGTEQVEGYHGEGNQAGPGAEYPTNMGGTYVVNQRDEDDNESK